MPEDRKRLAEGSLKALLEEPVADASCGTRALQKTPAHAVAFTTEVIFAYRAAAGSAFFLWHAKDLKHPTLVASMAVIPWIAARPNESRACQALARSLVWTRSSAPHQRRLGTPVGATPSSFTPPPPGTRIASQCCAVVQAPHCSDSHRASSLATLLQHHRWFRWSRRRLPDVMPNPGHFTPSAGLSLIPLPHSDLAWSLHALFDPKHPLLSFVV
ncbi:hypothetical protein VTN96DRAFT_6775 [Rasamsonia emersonii]